MSTDSAGATPGGLVAYTANVDEAPAYWQVGILWVLLATGEQTGGDYSLMWELCPKGSGPPPHYHDQDEQFFLIDGEITFLADGKQFVARSGSFVLIPRGAVHSFRVDSETATILNSYTPAGFERTVSALGEPAPTRTIPPADRPEKPADPAQIGALFEEIGMHVLDEPDVLRGATRPEYAAPGS